MALDVADNEAQWLRDLLSDIPMLETLIPITSINYDNEAMIAKVQCLSPRGVLS